MTMRQWLIEELADILAQEKPPRFTFQIAWVEDGFCGYVDGNEIRPDLPADALGARRSVGWMAGRHQYFLSYTILLLATNPDVAHWFALRFADELFGSGLPMMSMSFGVPFVRAWLGAQLDHPGPRHGVLHMDFDDGTAETVAW